MAWKEPPQKCPACGAGKKSIHFVMKNTHAEIKCNKCAKFHMVCPWCLHAHRTVDLPRFCENPACKRLFTMTPYRGGQ